MKEIKVKWVCRNIHFNTIEITESLTIKDFINGNRPSWITTDNAEFIAEIQFTGLLDINNIDLYEGDIVDNEAARWIIIFDRGCFCGKMIAVKSAHNDSVKFIVQQTEKIHLALRGIIGIKKIGNIYQNPEFLK